MALDLLVQLLFVIWILALGFYVVKKTWKERRLLFGRKRLPPGTMGWPFIGETRQFYSQDPNLFFSAKHKRYGDIFKSHILGCRCVMIADTEAVRFILGNKAHLFKPTFPASKQRLLGPNALFFHQGPYHSRIRRLVKASVSQDSIRGIFADIETIALKILESWRERSAIVAINEMRKYAFEVGIHAILDEVEERYKVDLDKYYHALKEGYNSLPVNLPGTLFCRSLEGRKKLSELLGQMIAQRKRERRERAHKAMLDTLMTCVDEKGEALSEEEIVDNVIGVLFAAHDTTATALTWLLKFLSENPSVLDAVTAEQEAIRQACGAAKGLSWADTRKMTFTAKVIQETLRIASIISFTFREAVEDVQYKEYVIPRGWKVMPLFRVIHHSPDFYEDPHKFDPLRFEKKPQKANAFMPFGNGDHSCPGNELAKVQMLVFIHHLTLNYRWQVVGRQRGIEYGPFPLPTDGLLVALTSTSEHSSSISAGVS